MSWEAANAPKRRKIVENESSGSAVEVNGGAAADVATAGLTTGSGNGTRANDISTSATARSGTAANTATVVRMSGETVEAALSRLSKAYLMSMECIGAAQRTDRLAAGAAAKTQQQQQRQDEEATSAPINNDIETVLHRVVHAARTTLESSILVDPLIVTYTPTLYHTMVELMMEKYSPGVEQEATTAEAVFAVEDGVDSDQTTNKKDGIEVGLSEAVDKKNINNDHQYNRWTTLLNRRKLAPPTINSSSRISKIRELAYLALVNYSDLLQSCGPPGPGAATTKDNVESGGKKLENAYVASQETVTGEVTTPEASRKTVLDRGVINRLSSISRNGCWGSSESYLTTHRLVVAALCDASHLDGSDPVLWLKLACASRRLEAALSHDEEVKAGRPMSTIQRSKYRRLQRYALEQGLTALPSHMPPNRTIVRALNEFNNEPEPDIYISIESPSPIVTRSKTLELTRYSWTMLGQMIIRSCRGDESLWSSDRGHLTKMWHQQQDLFGSPTIVIRMSPVLSLPKRVLGNVCTYLDDPSVRSFQATCRALSTSVVPHRSAVAKVFNQQQRNVISASLLTEQQQDQAQSMVTQEPAEEGSKDFDEANDTRDGGSEAKEGEDSIFETAGNELGATSAPVNEVSTTRPKRKLRTEGQRSSKRVRSNEERSGKKQERIKKRNSFEYCFAAATTACTIQQHNSAVSKLRYEPMYNQLFGGTHLWNNMVTHRVRKNMAGGKVTASEFEASERISESSLSTFIVQCSSRNSGPMDLLDKFIRHVALHVQDVFGITEEGAKAGLVTCMLQGFDVLASRSGSYQALPELSFLPLKTTGSFAKSVELFAMDVLHAELLLRQNDRIISAVVNFDDAENRISIMIPQLVDAASILENATRSVDSTGTKEDLKIQLLLISLLVRCYWVVAGYYFWRSKVESSPYTSKEAEEEGIWFLGKAVSSFDSLSISHLESVSTPHLSTAMRDDICWSELSPATLSKFRNEVQASSVISDARQQFEELVTERRRMLDQELQSDTLTSDAVASFASIGSKLYERYDSRYGESTSKLSELIDDAIEVHEADLLYGDTAEERLVDEGTKIVSVKSSNFSQFETRDYSILSMLTSCLSTDSSNSLMLATLITRLILTAKDTYKSAVEELVESPLRSEDGDGDAFSDHVDESLMCYDGNASSHSSDTVKRARKCICLTRILVDCLASLLDGQLSASEEEQLILTDEFSLAIYGCCEMVNLWFMPKRLPILFHEDSVDMQLLVAATKLMDLVRAKKLNSIMVETIYFHGLVHIVVRHHDILESMLGKHVERSGRNALQRVCIQRARFLGPAVSDLGSLLSTHMSEVNGCVLKRSSLFDVPSTTEALSLIGVTGLSEDEFSVFMHSVQRLWRYASQVEIENANPIDTANISSSFDRPIVKVLRIPVTTLIVGLCGSACQSRCYRFGVTSEEDKEDPLSLVEIFDSDASCNEWDSDGEEASTREEDRLKELLRVICHAVNCIRIVLEPITDKDLASLALDSAATSILGPRLPLIASRVLNFYADTLLVAFHVVTPETDVGQSAEDPLWAEFYPFRTQNIGHLLDAVLHKCYRWLYGFALISEATHVQSTGKDLASPANDIPEILSKKYKIESTIAAAQLYRCIVRAYAGGRRTPPKSALELVKSALPMMEESEKSVAIRRFLFDGKFSYLNLNDIEKLVKKEGGWKDKFASIHHFVCPIIGSSVGKESSFEENEVMKIRRGLSKQLASGPIPVDPTDLSSDDARVVMQLHEEEISKKFNYIIDDLCISDADDVEGWYQASQCLTVKADVIADRLGYNKGFTRLSNFSVPQQRSSRRTGIPIDQLEAYQAAERSVEEWIEYVGTDLSLYVDHAWSSFESLQACRVELKECCRPSNFPMSLQHSLLAGIDRKFDEKKFALWQEAWGGVFVAALRKLSLRCLGIALYILQTKESRSFPETIRAAEMCEAFGVAIYGNLMASQKYGYPMHSITTKEKRDFAVAAKTCFEASVELVDTSTTQDDASDDRTTWDLLLMVGKCHEKIASTYRGEEYGSGSVAANSPKPRRYADHMALAINAYKIALLQAKRIEDDGMQIVDQAGGSAHGSTEVLYRLHTARLKVHIDAVLRHENELRDAEYEALQLSEKEWFQNPANIAEDHSLRDRVWAVLADIVAALVECRRIQPFFHRSVFRHAQALLWSPVLHDPISSQGSLDTVPATRSVHIRGLNNSTSAAVSAEAVIKSLFDKKRSQLAAVWITTTAASSPLQILNSTIRKYDSVRGKYIAAYLEMLHLCERRGDIEIFMRWLYSAKVDLPAYFQASADAGYTKPAKSQAHDSLLVTDRYKSSMASQSLILSSKRQANSYLADLLIHEMNKAMSQSASEYKKVAEMYLKHAYASYLRLNCTPQDLKRVRAWKYGADSVREVEALCQAFSNSGHHVKNLEQRIDFGDWSGGSRKSAIFDAALSHCRMLYPLLSGINFFSKKSAPKTKKGTKDAKNDSSGDNEDQVGGQNTET